MGYNLSELTQEEKDKINVSLAASGVAFKERYNMPVVADTVLREQPQASMLFFKKGWCFIVQEANTILVCLMNLK